MEDLNENEELRKSAPTLFQLPEHDPFIVPEGFFERFPHEVQAMVATPRRAPLGLWLKRAAFALPVLAAIAFGIHSLSDHHLLGTDALPSIALSSEEAAHYTASIDMDTEDILAGADAAEWPVFDSVTVQLTPDEALAYVDRENIDLTEIIANP